MKKHSFLPAALTLLAVSALAADLPRKAPELAIPLPDGKQAKLSDYRGKVVAVAFILTTCPHCQKTTGVLSGIQRDLGPKGFQVLEAAFNEDPDMPRFIRDFKPAFPVGALDRKTVTDFMQISMNQRTFVPFFLLIDRRGMIRKQWTGGEDFLSNEATQEQNIRGEVEKLLNETAARR